MFYLPEAAEDESAMLVAKLPGTTPAVPAGDHEQTLLHSSRVQSSKSETAGRADFQRRMKKFVGLPYVGAITFYCFATGMSTVCAATASVVTTFVAAAGRFRTFPTASITETTNTH